ncbi:hypothetical protein [Azospirillum largimobile]
MFRHMLAHLNPFASRGAGAKEASKRALSPPGKPAGRFSFADVLQRSTGRPSGRNSGEADEGTRMGSSGGDKAERDRWRTVFASPEAQDRPDAACTMLATTNMPPAKILAALVGIPKPIRGNPEMIAAMDAFHIPKIGAAYEGPALSEDQQATHAVLASLNQTLHPLNRLDRKA